MLCDHLGVDLVALIYRVKTLGFRRPALCRYFWSRATPEPNSNQWHCVYLIYVTKLSLSRRSLCSQLVNGCPEMPKPLPRVKYSAYTVLLSKCSLCVNGSRRVLNAKLRRTALTEQTILRRKHICPAGIDCLGRGRVEALISVDSCRRFMQQAGLLQVQAGLLFLLGATTSLVSPHARASTTHMAFTPKKYLRVGGKAANTHGHAPRSPRLRI